MLARTYHMTDELMQHITMNYALGVQQHVARMSILLVQHNNMMSVAREHNTLRCFPRANSSIFLFKHTYNYHINIFLSLFVPDAGTLKMKLSIKLCARQIADVIPVLISFMSDVFRYIINYAIIRPILSGPSNNHRTFFFTAIGKINLKQLLTCRQLRLRF